jgi:hypothetical protein
MQDPERSASRPEWCPGCGSWNVRAVMAGEQVNFLCRECGCCWRHAGDRFREVDPRTCPGCSSRAVCVRRLWEPLRRAVNAGHHDRDEGTYRDPWC